MKTYNFSEKALKRWKHTVTLSTLGGLSLVWIVFGLTAKRYTVNGLSPLALLMVLLFSALVIAATVLISGRFALKRFRAMKLQVDQDAISLNTMDGVQKI